MTILNINIEKKKKKEISEIVKKSELKSVSQFVRLSIDEKLIIEKTFNNKMNDVEMPDWIPDGKFVAFVNNAIAAVGDSPQQVAHEAIQKFPDFSLIIKKKGNDFKIPEYAFSAFPELKCWNYSKFQDQTFPLISAVVGQNDKFLTVLGLPDSAASISLLERSISQELGLKPLRLVPIQTAKGTVELNLVKATIKFQNFTFESEFLESDISEQFPFKLLIGRNLLDLLDLYLFGKKQIVCLKDP